MPVPTYQLLTELRTRVDDILERSTEDSVKAAARECHRLLDDALAAHVKDEKDALVQHTSPPSRYMALALGLARGAAPPPDLPLLTMGAIAE